MLRTKLAVIFLFLLVASVVHAYSLKPLKGILIMLDPGHGGADPGAVGKNGLKESATNLRVARYLRTLLEADGAEVIMTREKDTALSLADRVAMAAKIKPDLFVSIHHNASLKPISENRSEVYYNAIDYQISRKVSDNMTRELLAKGFGAESRLIPAGFFVLRNNISPSILTEAGYISLPEIEKELSTGKSLTNQAQALRRSIRSYFANGILKVKFFVADDPIKIDTPFLNLIFTANHPVEKVNARFSSESNPGFGFDPLPAVNQTYRLYNLKPLVSGKYELQLSFTGPRDLHSARTIMNLQVDLPLAHCSIEPSAPFIPVGFKGNFPLKATLRDDQKNLNNREVNLSLVHDGEISASATVNKAESTIYLKLSGKEKGKQEIELVNDGQVIARTSIQVGISDNRFFLARLVNSNGEGIAGAKIFYNDSQVSISDPAGYFYCSGPMNLENMELEILPPFGYEKTGYTLKTSGEPVVFPIIELKAVAEKLLGKKIAIMAPIKMDNAVRQLVKPLMLAGAEISRLGFPETRENPEYQAVLEANLIKDLDLLISIKRTEKPEIMVRHYHRGGRGKKIADAFKNKVLTENPAVKINVAAGSDYELGHTGASAVVFYLPADEKNTLEQIFANSLIQTLKDGF